MTDTTTTTAHVATIEDMVKHYVNGEADRLKEHGKYEEGDDAMLRQEAQELFAQIWNAGQMSSFQLQFTVEQLVDNGFDSMGGDLESALEASKENANPYR